MKRFKKILFALLILSFSTSVFGQAYGRVCAHSGFGAGPTLVTYTWWCASTNAGNNSAITCCPSKNCGSGLALANITTGVVNASSYYVPISSVC
jgi:hypothetical protein